MPLSLQEANSLTPQELARRFSVQELEEFLRQQQPVSTEQLGGAFDITPFDPQSDFFSGQNLGALASNILPSAGNLISDLVTAVTSPIKTAKAIGETGVSGILSALGERFGGLENIKRTAVEDPFGLALDVAPGLQGVGAATKGTGIAARALRAANPIGLGARGAQKVGQAGGALARSTASIASGIDQGVLRTGREVLSEVGDFGQTQRQAFRAAQRGRADTQGAIEQVSRGIGQELDNIATVGKAKFQNVPVSPELYQSFLKDLTMDLRNKDIVLRPDGFDFSRSVIPKDKGAQAAIRQAYEFAIEPLRSPQLNIGEIWLARKRIDQAASNALKQKFGDFETGTLKQIRGELSEFLKKIDNEDFQRFNGEYSAAAAMREHFDMLVSGKIDPDNQVAALVRAIKGQRELSEAFITQVERKMNVPLRAIAAGRELSTILPRGLIGRGLIASVPVAAALQPEVLVGLLLSPPRLVGNYLRGIGATSRAIQQVGTLVEKVMSIPTAAALAEQGLTFWAILQQLDEREPPQPILQPPAMLAQLGQARGR